MKKILLIFMLNSAFILSKQNLEFKIEEKTNENIKILITKDKNQVIKEKTTITKEKKKKEPVKTNKKIDKLKP